MENQSAVMRKWHALQHLVSDRGSGKHAAKPWSKAERARVRRVLLRVAGCSTAYLQAVPQVTPARIPI